MTDLQRFDDEMNYGFRLHSIRSREQNGCWRTTLRWLKVSKPLALI
jgi:hypothetical protein